MFPFTICMVIADTLDSATYFRGVEEPHSQTALTEHRGGWGGNTKRMLVQLRENEEMYIPPRQQSW